MAFDISTAKPITSGFDVSTAKPVSTLPGQKPEEKEIGFRQKLLEGGFPFLKLARTMSAEKEKNIVSGEVGLRGAGKILPTFMTGQIPAPGERTLLGNITDRPGAAVREAIRAPFGQKAEAFTGGAAFPEQVESFQDEALRKLAPKTESVYLNYLGGLPVSSGGLALDILTNPADVLSLLIGKVPIPKSLGGGTVGARMAESRPMSAINQFINRPVRFPKVAQVLKSRTDDAIVTLMDKSVPYTPSRLKTSTARTKYNANRIEAVKTIIENREALKITDLSGNIVNKLPGSADEFSQAIHQTEKVLFDSYDDILKASGQMGQEVNLEPIANSLNDIIESKTIKFANPDAITEAIRLRNALLEQKTLSAKEANNIIEMFNQQLGPAYRKGFIPKGTPESVKATIADGLRKSIDDLVIGIDDGKFQIFKNKYHALRTIEEDVNRAAGRIAGKKPSGISNVLDAFSGGNIAQGIIRKNPGQIAKGVTIAAIKDVSRYKTNPDRLIRMMFENVAKTHIPNAVTIPSNALSNQTLLNQSLKMIPPQFLPIVRQSLFRQQGQNK